MYEREFENAIVKPIGRYIFTMSLRGRYIIDRIKQATSKYMKFPVPPYGDPIYWDGAYKNFGPSDSFEWGNISLENDLLSYEYTDITSNIWNSQQRQIQQQQQQQAEEDPKIITRTTTLAETIGVYPRNYDPNFDDIDVTDDEAQDIEEPILMIGCGNSPLGEDMIIKGNWNGPIIQVDVSSRICDAMSIRNKELIENGTMNFVLDDATELSAFRSNGNLLAAIDKGLIDALFCADEYDQCHSVLKNVCRILQPGGIFVFMSFSRPEFILPKILSPSPGRGDRALTKKRQRNATPNDSASSLLNTWDSLQIQETSKIMLYRFQKPSSASSSSTTSVVMKKKRKGGTKRVLSRSGNHGSKVSNTNDDEVERDENPLDDNQQQEQDHLQNESTIVQQRGQLQRSKKMSYKKKQR